jgi:putative aldouronate transport system permease protein
VYRVGILGGQDISYAAAIGFLESVICLVLIVGANYVSRKLSGEGIY